MSKTYLAGGGDGDLDFVSEVTLLGVLLPEATVMAVFPFSLSSS